MAPTYQNETESLTFGSSSIDVASGTGSTSDVLLMFVYSAGVTATGMSGGGLTYTQRGSANAGGVLLYWYTSSLLTSSSAVTVSYTGSGSGTIFMSVFRYTGCAATPVGNVSVNSDTSGTTGNPSGGSITTGSGNTSVLTVWRSSGGTYTTPSGYTSRYSSGDGRALFDAAGPLTDNPSATHSGNSSWTAMHVELQAPAAAARRVDRGTRPRGARINSTFY